jgi:hypothetical protein
VLQNKSGSLRRMRNTLPLPGIQPDFSVVVILTELSGYSEINFSMNSALPVHTRSFCKKSCLIKAKERRGN